MIDLMEVLTDKGTPLMTLPFLLIKRTVVGMSVPLFCPEQWEKSKANDTCPTGTIGTVGRPVNVNHHSVQFLGLQHYLIQGNVRTF